MHSSRQEVLVSKMKGVAAGSAAEHILNLFKAGLATAPFCGGVASLISDYIPSMKQRRMEEFVDQITSDLRALKDRVDESELLTDEFAYIFEQCFRGIAKNYQAEKISAFRGILVNAAVGESTPNDEKEYFLGLVDTLSALHLRILAFMTDPLKYLESRNIPVHSIRGGFSTLFPVAFPGVDLQVIRSAFGELYQAGLVNTDKTMFNTTTSAQGLDLLANRVTDVGHRFVHFCTSPAEMP